jgi:hypothetical protein
MQYNDIFHRNFIFMEYIVLKDGLFCVKVEI